MYLRRESARKPASTFQAYPFYPGIPAKLREVSATSIPTMGKKGNPEQLPRRIAVIVTHFCGGASLGFWLRGAVNGHLFLIPRCLEQAILHDSIILKFNITPC